MFTYIIYYIYVNVYIIYHICTCIYPAKNELGCISKVILDTANKNIREAMAEVCELVGNYLLYELSKLYEKKDKSGPE